MKQLSVSLSILCLALSLSLLPSCTSRSGPAETVVNGVHVPVLLPRTTALGTPDETALIRQRYDKSLAAIRANGDDQKPLLELAAVYITEGRVTGNGSYYGNAAIAMLDRVLEAPAATKDQRFQAFSLKSAVLLNLHRFPEALTVAEEGLALNDFNAGIYGALVDAEVELGHYAKAVQYCDRMLSIRPDLRSYSRASYLRQIHGDNAGAIEAMKLAVQAGVPGDEATEWARVTLGDLYLNTGHTDSALLTFRTALVYRPGYPHAEMGMARTERALGHTAEAIAHTKTAIRTLSEVSFVAYLGELYELNGQKGEAAKVRGDVVRLLQTAEREDRGAVRHNGNRELANAYLQAGDPDKALAYARKDWEQRPDNIDANELMATVYFRKGEGAAARPYAEKALATSTRYAPVLYRIGTILAGSGDTGRGKGLREQALQVLPWLVTDRFIAQRQ